MLLRAHYTLALPTAAAAAGRRLPPLPPPLLVTLQPICSRQPLAVYSRPNVCRQRASFRPAAAAAAASTAATAAAAAVLHPPTLLGHSPWGIWAALAAAGAAGLWCERTKWGKEMSGALLRWAWFGCSAVVLPLLPGCLLRMSSCAAASCATYLMPPARPAPPSRPPLPTARCSVWP